MKIKVNKDIDDDIHTEKDKEEGNKNKKLLGILETIGDILELIIDILN